MDSVIFAGIYLLCINHVSKLCEISRIYFTGITQYALLIYTII